ncbi:MAG: hypothetical protein VXW81_02830, partial [Pseudomonadota bacterium]|nr:hypothetical protein [Pseudomonadota bacterium]
KRFGLANDANPNIDLQKIIECDGHGRRLPGCFGGPTVAVRRGDDKSPKNNARPQGPGAIRSVRGSTFIWWRPSW